MTLDDLRASARAKSDEQTTGFISDTELDKFINQGLRFVYGKIVQRFEDYFIIPGTLSNGGLFSTVSGTQEYALPSDLQKVVRIEHRVTASTNDNDWKKLARTNIGNDRIDDYFPIREGYSPGFGHFIAGNNVYLRPVPSQGFNVRIWYVPRVTPLVLTTDIPGIPLEYHELVAEYAALQCLRKTGEPIYKESAELFASELANMLETVEIRDQEPEQMVITDDQDFDRYGF